MFRSPGDSSSSSSESDHEPSEEISNHVDETPQVTATTGPEQSQETLTEVEEIAIHKVSYGQHAGLGGTASQNFEAFRDMNYAALLEHYFLHETVKEFNQRSQSTRVYTEDDPEVRAIADQKFRSVSREMGNEGMLAEGLEGPEWQQLRESHRRGISFAAQNLLQHSEEQAGSPALAALHGLDPTATSGTANVRPQSRRLLPRNAETGTQYASLGQRIAKLQIEEIPTQRAMSPKYSLLATVPTQHEFYAARYTKDFKELGFLGKGGFGKVYRVQHHLDEQEYAIKKIILSPKRLKQLQDAGLDELQDVLKALLNEVRTLAKLDHTNIVRYFGGWVEHSSFMVDGPVRVDRPLPPRALLSDRPASSSEKFSLCNHFDDKEMSVSSQHGDGIQFGFSSKSDEEPSSGIRASEAKRRGSQATMSSIASKKSFMQSASDSDVDIEPIPRQVEAKTHQQFPNLSSMLHFLKTPSHEPTSEGETSGHDIFTDGEVNRPTEERTDTTHPIGPCYTLHIQMALYPLSLAAYLSLDPAKDGHDVASPLRHCYHVVPSIHLILAILSGIEYLHDQKVVHRDLKPANIFLSVHMGKPRSSGCVEFAKCKECKDHQCQSTYIVPRIGDFGLVADIDLPRTSASQRGGPSSFKIDDIAEPVPASYTGPGFQLPSLGKNKGVGTEFYRPPNQSGVVDEKLDVFSLGVIMFETLWKFGTSKITRRDT